MLATIGSVKPDAVDAKVITAFLDRVETADLPLSEKESLLSTGYQNLGRFGGVVAEKYLLERSSADYWRRHKLNANPGEQWNEKTIKLYRRFALAGIEQLPNAGQLEVVLAILG